MALEDIAAAQQRVIDVLRKRPRAGVSDDMPASASWDGALRARVSAGDGDVVVTDMPPEVGGGSTSVTPGWLLRAALASCAVTRIAMLAASEGIVLRSLQARATSRSDARGLWGLAEADGAVVSAAPGDVLLQVRIGADAVAPERLRALVAASAPLSPVTCALEAPLPVALQIEVEGDA
jgi:uncharacterized OsmC-like protein